MDLDAVPAEARETFEALLKRDLEPEADLLQQIANYMDILIDLKEGLGRDIDMHQAEALADRSATLLSGVGPETADDHRRLIQAAVRYFIDASDSDRDFRPGGLVDDVEVMNAVTAALQRPDLHIAL